MKRLQRIEYDKAGEVLYVTLEDAPSVSQQNFTDNVVLDFAEDGGLIGIELLDPDADLQGVVKDYRLDPHLLDVLAKIRALIPETHERLVLA